MIYSLRYGIYDSTLHQTWRLYDAIRKTSLYLLALLLIYLLLFLVTPILLVLLAISWFFGLISRLTPPNQIVKNLTPSQYRILMKAYARMNATHLRLANDDVKGLPFLLRFLHYLLLKDLSATATHRAKVMAALDKKLATKEGRFFKSIDHKDLWANRATVYAYKF